MFSKLTYLLNDIGDFDERVSVWRAFCKEHEITGLVPGEIIDLEWEDRASPEIEPTFATKATLYKQERTAMVSKLLADRAEMLKEETLLVKK